MTDKISEVKEKAEAAISVEPSAYEVYYTRSHVICENNMPTKTQVQFADDCDIHTIVARYMPEDLRAKVLGLSRASQYGSMDMNANVLESYDQFKQVETYFNDLPDSVRKEFGYNLKKFLIASQDPAQYDNFAKFGIYTPRVKEEVNGPSSSTSDLSSKVAEKTN